MDKKKKVTAFAFLAVFPILLMLISSIFCIQSSIYTPYNVNGSPVEFTIKEGENVNAISENLKKKGIIKNKNLFGIYVWQKKIENKLQAGNYELSSSMTIPEIARFIVIGNIKSDNVWITIPEGFSDDEIDKKLAQNGLISRGEFTRRVKEYQGLEIDFSKYEFLKEKPKGIGLNGYLFPDTYKYHKNSSIDEIIEKMLDNFDNKLSPDLRKDIKKQRKSVFEIVVLASIIEKEAGRIEDMGKISSVFQNRLKVGKPLESDATINYITGSRRIQSTYEDIQIDSPYNTYMHKGLPPSPISNPGIQAIKSAIYPEKTDYFYFLTKKGGEAVFSKTYNEHIKNKAKYLK